MAQSFKQWMMAVDVEIVRICGLTHDDLADYCYRDEYEDDVDPKETAHEVLSQNGWGEFINDGERD